jgi:DNA-binding XRE family transcriptional regulator
MMKENVKKLRQILFWSQTDLATAIGVTRGTINNYESGHRSPRFRELKALVQLAKQHNIDVNFEGNE